MLLEALENPPPIEGDGGDPLTGSLGGWLDQLRQAAVPATSPESDAFSRDLKRRGFSFVGSTVIYAHMQAVGMVNDHLAGCFRYREVTTNSDR